MLDFITKSKIRRGLLLLFLYNPQREYYINQAAKLINTSSGTAQRELEKLAASGILRKEKRANLAFFKANEKNPLYHDVKSIIAKTIGIEYLLKKGLDENDKIKFAFLFGSYVKGDLKPDSDIDLFVIGAIKDSELHQLVTKVEEKIKREINYHFAGPEDFKKNLAKSFFHKEILSNYLLLVGDKNEFGKFIKTTAKRGEN